MWVNFISSLAVLIEDSFLFKLNVKKFFNNGFLILSVFIWISSSLFSSINNPFSIKKFLILYAFVPSLSPFVLPDNRLFNVFKSKPFWLQKALKFMPRFFFD